MKTSILFLVAFLFANNCFSQNSTLDVRHVVTTDFPKVSGDLWVRNPGGINTSSIDLFEESSDKPIKATFSNNQVVTDSVAKNKCIVFLILNPGPLGRKELNWYKSVIKNAVAKGVIKKGDKVEVLDFNNESVGQLLYPSGISFTDSSAGIFKKLDNIASRNAKCLCSAVNNRSLIYQAINQTLDQLEKQNLIIPAGVFVLADDRACLAGSTGETPGIRSRRLNIPIFGITYNKPGQINSIKTLCEESFGLYFSDPNNSLNNNAARLDSFLTNFLQRQAGFYYKFNYTSTYEKDGKSHPVKVISKADKTAFLIAVPNKNLFEWIKANPVLAGILLLLIAGLIFVALRVIKKYREKKEIEKRVHDQQLSEMDRAHKENEEILSAKLSSHQQELEHIKKKGQEQKEAEQRKKEESEYKAREIVLIAQMRLKGNFPWFDYSSGDGVKHRYEIKKPVTTVGRGSDCDLRIDLPTISKKHFQLIYKSNDEYWVKDTGSSNGVYLNGNKISESKIKHGDFLQIGELVLNFFI